MDLGGLQNNSPQGKTEGDAVRTDPTQAASDSRKPCPPLSWGRRKGHTMPISCWVTLWDCWGLHLTHIHVPTTRRGCDKRKQRTQALM